MGQPVNGPRDRLRTPVLPVIKILQFCRRKQSLKQIRDVAVQLRVVEESLKAQGLSGLCLNSASARRLLYRTAQRFLSMQKSAYTEKLCSASALELFLCLQ